MMRNSDQRGVPTEEWSGSVGFARFSGSSRFAVPDAAHFRSTWRQIVADGVRAGEWSTTPIAGSRPLDREAGSVSVVLVTDGSVSYHRPSGELVRATPGSVHVLHASEQVRFAVPQDVTLMSVSVPVTFLTRDGRTAALGMARPVEPSRVTAGLTALVSQVLDPRVGGAQCPGARALRPMAVATIESTLPVAADYDLRQRILDHIDHEIRDPELSPGSIAAMFGISLRWVHHVFNVEGDSIAYYIRERRLDLVAAKLEHDRRSARIGALAEQFGFASRDTLTRSFKLRYGMTIAEYAALASDGHAPDSRTEGFITG